MTYFVGIGAQKSGTTWLAEYLYDHPDVFMSPYKEMRFFDSKWNFRRAASMSNFRQWWTRRHIDLAKYGPFNFIENRDESDDIHKLYIKSCFRSDSAYFSLINYGAAGKICSGEITPTYSDLSASAFRDMDRILPGCKFIFIARNPADRFASQLKMHQKKQSHRKLPVQALLTSHHYRRRGDYKRTLEELFSVVGRERVIVLFYERLFDPATANDCVRRLCAHLGISYLSGDISRIADPHLGADEVVLTPDERALIVRNYAPVFEYMREFDPDGLPARWEDDLRSTPGLRLNRSSLGSIS